MARGAHSLCGPFFCLKPSDYNPSCGIYRRHLRYARGGIVMTPQQKEKIIRMRREGFSYASISKDLGMSENTVKSFFRRNNFGIAGATTGVQNDGILCRLCGTLLTQTAGVKPKRYCSDKCRLTWWNQHPEAVNRKAIYTFICPICGREFESYGNKHRKYCSRTCYGRSKAGHHE